MVLRSQGEGSWVLKSSLALQTPTSDAGLCVGGWGVGGARGGVCASGYAGGRRCGYACGLEPPAAERPVSTAVGK